MAAELSPDEQLLVGHVVSSLTLMTSSVVTAVGKERAWLLIDAAFARVRERAEADGLLPAKRTSCRVENLQPDQNGIVSVKHGLGSEKVTVKLFNAQGQPRRHRRLGVPISPDEMEVIAQSLDVSYADVEVIPD